MSFVHCSIESVPCDGDSSKVGLIWDSSEIPAAAQAGVSAASSDCEPASDDSGAMRRGLAPSYSLSLACAVSRGNCGDLVLGSVE